MTNNRTFMPKVNTEEELSALQLEGLKWTVSHAFNNSGFYRKKFEENAVGPDDIKSHDDISRLPLTNADDFREGYPFPLLCVPMKDVVRIHASSGTTGKRKVLSYTQKDIDDWADMFARCYELAELTREDRVQIAVGYGLWSAGVGFQAGVERLGATALPVGPGNIDLHCEVMVDLEATVLCATASMALLLAEEVKNRGIRDSVRLKKVIMGAERSSSAMKERMKELLGVEHVFDIPGLTELYGPGAGLDCTLHTGIHYHADYYILEILDPNTLEPVAPGDPGEMVVTTLKKQAAPLIRYRTRDMTRLIPGRCPCGSVLPRHDRIFDRSDDMFVFRGVNIYPSQVDELVSRVDGAGSEYQIQLKRGGDGREYMIVVLERDEAADPALDEILARSMADLVKRKIMVRAQIRVVGYGTLPRTQSKSKRVFDTRDQ